MKPSLLAALVLVVVPPALTAALLWLRLPAFVAAAETAATERPRPLDAQPPWDFWTLELENLAAELRTRSAQLDERADLLRQHEARLAAERAELEQLRRTIERQREEIRLLITEVATDELRNLRTLAQTYANLTPRAAVAIFNEMDDTTVVKILALMKADSVGPIFEEMSRPGDNQALRAARLSERLRLLRARPANS
jgi:flagellar motility protein MotE (MotC chaperone)